MPLGPEKRLARRVAVMAAARKLVAQHGYDGTTMQRIADDCSVTPKTLYNTFGSKDQLIAEAVEELFRKQLRRAAEHAGVGGLDRILALRATIISEYETDPTYARELLLAFRSSRQAAPLGEAISRMSREPMLLGLGEMQAAGQLTEWANVDDIATALSAHEQGIVFAWAEHDAPVAWLADKEMMGQYLILYAATTGDARVRLGCLLEQRATQNARQTRQMPA